MSTFSEAEKKFLLSLARATITDAIARVPQAEKTAAEYQRLQEKRGCFVTLHKKGALRGCIGTIEPLRTLVECVRENALNAAFQDPRFAPLRADELPEIDIEVSVLTVPRRLDFTDGDDLQRKLMPNVHGVILSQGGRRATFLPQVWDQLPDCRDFLGHLCLKAGLNRQAWMDKATSIMVYEAEYFSENE